ncbi:MAG TPA: hypothetical protein VK934_12165, partial [Fimbriimonas sp.]|nr:hypothetical protein [Fimbriimonas sp.]
LLVLFAAGALWVNPSRALFACCSVGVAFLSIPTLASYASAPVATAIGAVLAFGCAGLIFRERRGWVLGGLVGLLALAFLTAEHGMLVAWLIAAAIVAGTVMTFWRRGQAVANGASLR